jgi:hypothetical protein
LTSAVETRASTLVMYETSQYHYCTGTAREISCGLADTVYTPRRPIQQVLV